MWLQAFPVEAGASPSQLFSAVLVPAAAAVSVVAFAREVGPEYELKGSRVGILLVIVAILAYLAGTSVQSTILHILSIPVFYWGCVLYLAGPRSLVSTLPGGLIIASVFIPLTIGPLGLVYIDAFSWALLITSVGLVWETSRKSVGLACFACEFFKVKGETFCFSCGSLVGRLKGPRSTKLLGFAVFAVAMLAVLTLSVPVLLKTPGTSLVNLDLGGPQLGNHFAPLSGWSAEYMSVGGGSSVNGYLLTHGKTAVEAFLTASQDPASPLSTLNKTRAVLVTNTIAPPTIAKFMSGYTFMQKGTRYVGLQGVFQVTWVNGSKVLNAFLGVDLRQPQSSFLADNGASLYSAASSLINWASASAGWTTALQSLTSSYGMFTQAAYIGSFGGFAVVLFALARDDELAKARRLDSLRALGASETAVLNAFLLGPRSTTGEELRQLLTWKVNQGTTDLAFYSSLNELVRRGLVSPSVSIHKGVPRLLWRRLI